MKPQEVHYGVGIRYFILLLLIIFLAIMAASCTKTIYVPIETVRYVKQEVHDTVVSVKLEQYHDTIATKDTISFLENPYAYTSASYGDGILHHSLGIKATPVKIQLKYVTTTIRDSIAKPYMVEVVKEVNILTWWQAFQIKWFKIIAGGFLLYFAWTKRTYIVKFIRLLIKL